MGSSAGPSVLSVAQMFSLFSGELFAKVAQWERMLKEAPEALEQVEQEVQDLFLRGAGMVLAGLLALVLNSNELARKTEALRKNYERPLGKGRNRTVKIQMLGGFVMWIGSLYCEPRSRSSGTKKEESPGLFVELALFGFARGVSAKLQSTVARQSALCPSFQTAKEELRRMGTALNIKTVRRVTLQCGEGLLSLRTHQIQQWREEKLTKSSSMAGKRISVQIDGGRTRLREALKNVTKTPDMPNSDGLYLEDAPGRSKKTAKASFDPQWREPKLCTIFVHDKNGRMEKKSKATLDGTFEGPDAIAEIISMHLERLGAAEAESITFVADGATWIWDRIDKIVSGAKIPSEVKVTKVLDCCHATHHVSLALSCLDLNGEDRMALYRAMRTMLRNGEWKRVTDDLCELAEERNWPSTVATEIEYLRKHGEAGRLSYTQYREEGLPIGSGAIESSIRRVINRRLKGNGIYWKQENAESMLQLRCQVLSDHWDESIASMKKMKQTRCPQDWHWEAQNMSVKSEAENENAEKPTKSQATT